MLATAAGLAVLAILLAWPVPIALARAQWPSSAPATALVLWQAIALAGGLSMIGVPLCLSVAPYGDDLGSGIRGLAVAIAQGAAPVWCVVAVSVAVLLAAYLLAHLAVTTVRVERQRRRHHALLDLLAAEHPTQARTRVLDEAAPIAYCLPRGMGSATVLSSGLIALLRPDELDAVIAHERAHVEQRHDVVTLAFLAWRRALPRFPVAALAEERVAALVEMLADDRARRHSDDRVLARAIALVGGGAGADPVELAALPAGRMPAARVRRLVVAAPEPSAVLRVLVLVGAVLLVAAPTLWLLLPVVLAR